MKKPRIEIDYAPDSLDDWQVYLDGTPIGCPRYRGAMADVAEWLDDSWDELVAIIQLRAVFQPSQPEDELEEISHD